MKQGFEYVSAIRIAITVLVISLAGWFLSDLLINSTQQELLINRNLHLLIDALFALTVLICALVLIGKLLRKIREQKEVVRQRENRLRDTLDNLMIGCQLIDYNWKYLYVNEIAARHYKKQMDEIQGHTIMEIFPEIESTDIFAQLKTCMVKRVPYKMQNRFDYPNGTYAWYEISIVPVSEGLFVQTHEITRRKDAQMALINSTERLIEAQRIARLGDFTWNYRKGVVNMSVALYELLGYDRSEKIDFDKVNREIHYEEDLEEITNWLEDTMQSGSTILHPKEYRIYKRDKSIIYVRTSGIVDRSDPASPVIFATVQDINDQKLAELERIRKNEALRDSLHKIEQVNRELEIARKKAEASDNLKSAFIANMSHEIRTPLNGLLGFTNLLVSSENLNTEVKQKYTKFIKNCSDDILQIVTDILDISSLETGAVHLKEEPVKVNEILDQLYTLYNDKVSEKENPLTLKRQTFGREIVLFTDEKRFKQIINNLLDNAIKFTEKGEIEFGVEKLENESVNLFVRDTGIGISQENYEIIFDRFRQVQTSRIREYGGNGLGLAIVKEIVKLLKGEIWLDSEVENGTCFHIKLPYQAVIPANPKEEKTVNVPRNTGKQLKILIVEDNELNMQYIKEVIQFELKCSITSVAYGRKAITLVKDNNFDLILLDIRLPDISGLDVAKEIRTFNTSVYIIAQTAFAMDEDEQMALAAGCNTYLSKPISSQDILTKIQEAQTVEE